MADDLTNEHPNERAVATAIQIFVYTYKNKMAKYLQWKIIYWETTCKKTL